MCDINNSNFKENFQQLKESFYRSKFIAIDLEFSGLRSMTVQKPSLFDSPKQRYEKLRNNLEFVSPVQVGITAFHFDSNTNDYFGEVYNFHVIPASFLGIDKAFVFQSSAISFLCMHNFDFNKFAYLGIPYVNRREEEQLLNKLKNGTLIGERCQLNLEYHEAITYFTPAVELWYNKAQIENCLEIPEIIKRYKKFSEIIYFLHKYFRNQFKNVWTYVKNDCFFIKRVSEEQFEELEYQHKNQLEEDLVAELVGFRQIFTFLTRLKKPLIGHNLTTDLMIMYNCFELSLPTTYSEFKQSIHNLFPVVFDTKTLYYELRMSIPKVKDAEGTSLKTLFTYFKDGHGRHLSNISSAITSNLPEDKIENYHEAGWDSFCTGYIFLRMGFYKLSLLYPKRKDFVCSEIFGSLSEYKNAVNVIRGSINHMKLDGNDPYRIRPPWLVVESGDYEPLDVVNLISHFKTFGPVDIKITSKNGRRVLVAVDTERTAKEICKNLKKNSNYSVKKYNIFLHSTNFETCLIAGFAMTGTMILIYIFKSWKNGLLSKLIR